MREGYSPKIVFSSVVEIIKEQWILLFFAVTFSSCHSSRVLLKEVDHMVSPSSAGGVAAPRAVAIMLGHLGATQSQLQEYAAWYQQRSCRTVQSASPPLRFLCNASLQPTSVSVWKETVQTLRDTPSSVPLVVHMFSNGGSFLWEAMDRVLQQEEQDEGGDGLSAADRQLLKTRLQSGYLLFDSCPCYIRTLWDTSTPWNASFPYPGSSPWARAVYTGMAATALTTWLTVTLSWSKPRLFWEQVTQSTTCGHHVYVYTTTDLASDAAAVDRLIAQRRQQEQEQQANGIGPTTTTTKQYRYEDSNHVRIHRDHPEEYQKMIDDALAAAIARAATAEEKK